jgi:topoisomerase-4 subunit A
MHSTDKILVFASDGRFYTVACDKVPRGRGQAVPVRLLIELGEEHDVVALVPYRPGGKLLLAASDGRGFITRLDNALAQTRSGKQVMNVGAAARAQIGTPADGDTVAVIGENRKLLLFPLKEIPEMSRGRGVRLQRYRLGGLSDAKVFALADGLAWIDPAGRVHNEPDLRDWLGSRGQAGRLAPKGFNKSNRFA